MFSEGEKIVKCTGGGIVGSAILVHANPVFGDRWAVGMFGASDLGEKSEQDLAAMLEQYERRVESLTFSAGEKFQESESAGWDFGLSQEAEKLLAEAQKIWEEGDHVAEEFERRCGHAAFYGVTRFRACKPPHFDQRWNRKDLTTRTLPPSHYIDEKLPLALDNLLSLTPPSWWAHQQSLVNEEQRKAVLQPLLLCGRERWPMRFPEIHKFASYLVAANDHIRKEPFLDMYTAAKAITPIYSLGLSLEALKEVKGADSKLRSLYRGPSAEVDSTIFELLVAAAFASKGHDVAFIEETAQKKTPDLRLHNMPYPTVIECKRRQPLNEYEKKEFSVIREVFALLCSERIELGLVGELTIDFTQEIKDLSASGIVERIRKATNSLSPYVNEEAEWGTIHLRPVEVSQEFERTRLYSPEFLEKVFGTDLESDEFDGICVVAANDGFPEVDRAELPLLLKWTSNSLTAQQSKMQTIRNLWIEAVDQIPADEAGLIYLAYEEGHRPSLADARTNGIREFVGNMYFKRPEISIPMTVISRLYPNVVLEGRPDFIESTIPLASGGWNNFNYWTQKMPTRVFTF